MITFDCTTVQLLHAKCVLFKHQHNPEWDAQSACIQCNLHLWYVYKKVGNSLQTLQRPHSVLHPIGVIYILLYDIMSACTLLVPLFWKWILPNQIFIGHTLLGSVLLLYICTLFQSPGLCTHLHCPSVHLLNSLCSILSANYRRVLIYLLSSDWFIKHLMIKMTISMDLNCCLFTQPFWSAEQAV